MAPHSPGKAIASARTGSKVAGTRSRRAPARIVPSAATPSSGSATAPTHAPAAYEA